MSTGQLLAILTLCRQDQEKRLSIGFVTIMRTQARVYAITVTKSRYVISPLMSQGNTWLYCIMN